MKYKIGKDLFSILIASPLYFKLPLKTRHFLLSKLMSDLQGALNDYDDEKIINQRSIETGSG